MYSLSYSHRLSPAYRPLNLTFCIPFCNSLALIIQLLTATQPQLNLRPSPLQIKLKWNERQTLRRHLTPQLINLAPMQKQLPVPHGIVVVTVTVLIDRNMCILQPQLVVASDSV